MVAFVQGNNEMVAGLLYGDHHPDTLNYLSSQLQQPSQMLQQSGQAFMDRARAVYDRFNGSQAMQMAKAVKRQLQGVWQRDLIRPLNSIAEMQHPPDVMIRYLMSHPTLQRQYEAQAIHGYEGRWSPMDEGRYGEDNYHYRRVMQHMEVEHDTGEVYCYSYLDDLLEGDRELDFQERLSIQETWTRLSAELLNGGEDPTSPYNARL